jgi:hypothetical protein
MPSPPSCHMHPSTSLIRRPHHPHDVPSHRTHCRHVHYCTRHLYHPNGSDSLTQPPPQTPAAKLSGRGGKRTNQSINATQRLYWRAVRYEPRSLDSQNGNWPVRSHRDRRVGWRRRMRLETGGCGRREASTPGQDGRVEWRRDGEIGERRFDRLRVQW